MKFRIFFAIVLFFFSTTLQKYKNHHHHSNIRKLKLIKLKTHRKEKHIRKLMADLVLKIVEKIGVKTFTHDLFKEVYGGITNIKMAKEDPFLVVNTYPINQYMLKGPKPDIDLTNSFSNGRLI